MPEPDMFEAIVVGGGAAGLSAALILGRACRSVLVLDDGRPRNAVADRMHGFISRDGTPPLDLLAAARAELQRYPSVVLAQGHVEAVSGVFIPKADASPHLSSKMANAKRATRYF